MQLTETCNSNLWKSLKLCILCFNPNRSHLPRSECLSKCHLTGLISSMGPLPGGPPLIFGPFNVVLYRERHSSQPQNVC